MAKNKGKKQVANATDAQAKRGPLPGVYVTRRGREDDKVLAFQGKEYGAMLQPSGDLVITEMMPDVMNQNKGEPIPKVRRFIAEGTWDDVMVIE